jgi:hypothetical protein
MNMSNKKRDMFFFVPNRAVNPTKWEKVYTARGEWYRRYRMSRVFNLDPFTLKSKVEN